MRSLHKDIKLLRKNISTGWVQTGEVAAGVRVCTFVITAHTKSTVRGAADAGGNALEALRKSADKSLKEAVDAFFTVMPQPYYWEGRRHNEI